MKPIEYIPKPTFIERRDFWHWIAEGLLCGLLLITWGLT